MGGQRMQQAKSLVIDGTSLTMKQISDFLENPDMRTVLASEALVKMAALFYTLGK